MTAAKAGQMNPVFAWKALLGCVWWDFGGVLGGACWVGKQLVLLESG